MDISRLKCGRTVAPRQQGMNCIEHDRGGGSVRIVASIEEPTAIRAILDHFAKHAAMEEAHYRPAARAPPAVAA